MLSQQPDELARLVRSGKSHLWVERLVRGLDERLDGGLELPSSDRDSAGSTWLPDHVVPIVGALSPDDGALGAIVLTRSEHALASPEGHHHAEVGGFGELEDTARQAIGLTTEVMTEFLPNALRPRPEIQVEHASTGDSLALAAGIGALLRLYGVGWPRDLIVTGGLSADGRGFAPVPEETLPGKIAAIKRWGFTRLGVVEAQAAALPEVIEGVRIVALPSNPAELPSALAGLDGVDLAEADIARALALFDLRIVRGARAEIIKRVLDVTERFTRDASPLVRHLAYDMRSRTLLHAGRSDEASEALKEADALRGIGDLPDGRLRDVLRYQQAAHRSVVHLDLGDWANDHPAHRAVDQLLAELDGRWNTRHERLMRFFLANTRARRLEYLGRLHGRRDLLEQAWTDLVRDQDEWHDLIEAYAIGELHLKDTTIDRIQNQLVDVAASLVALGEELPADWRRCLETFGARSMPLEITDEGNAVFAFTNRIGETVLIGGSGFDALAHLRRHRALGMSGVPAELEGLLDSSACRPLRVDHPWRVWYEELALLALASGRSIAPPELDPATSCPIGWTHMSGPSSGITRILALRSAYVLDRLDIATPAPEPPQEGTSLRTLFDALRAQPERLFRRVPY